MAGYGPSGLNRRFGQFTDVFKLDGQFKDFIFIEPLNIHRT